MTWILIIVFWYGYGTTNAVVEFNSEKSCIEAAKKIEADINSIQTTYSCIPKPKGETE